MSELSAAHRNERKRGIPHFFQWLPWLVLATALGLTWQLWNTAQKEALAGLKASFNFRALDTINQTHQRLKSYVRLIEGISSLYISSDHVERSEFHSYIEAMDLKQNHPGIQGVNFVKLIRAPQKTEYIDSVRREGFPGFSIFPEGGRDIYCPVTYVEPFSTENRKIFGLDTCADPKRSLAKTRARDSGKLSMTAKTVLFIESPSAPQAGIVMVSPIYAKGMPHSTVSERRANIDGWIAAMFRMEMLMGSILGNSSPDLDVEIYDGDQPSAQTLLYDTDKSPDFHRMPAYRFSLSEQITIADRTWTIAITPTPGFIAQLDTDKPKLIAYGGVGISMLLTLITLLLVQGRARALKAATRMNSRLIASEERLREAQHIAQLGSWELDLATNKLFWSDEMFALFELDKTASPATYELFLGVIHPDDRSMVGTAYKDSLKTRKPYEITYRLLMSDGRIKWINEKYTTQFDSGDKPVRSIGTLQDVTAQKLVEDIQSVTAVAFETHEAILITDADANILRVNRAFERITGYSAEEVTGKNPRILNSGQHDQAFFAQLWQTLLNTGLWNGEVMDRHKDGTLYPTQLTITAVKDAKGKTTHYVAFFFDISERKRTEEEIRHLAFFDALTNLPNRRLLMDRLNIALSASSRNKKYGALLFLDLDNFKTINDSQGHEAGDALLIEVANRLQACVREEDTVSRLGGDEFVVLIDGISKNAQEASKNISYVAEKIRTALANPYEVNGVAHHSSPSIGISVFFGNRVSAEELLRRADMAMYQAKDAGRNRVRFFDPQMQQTVEARIVMESDLRHAIAESQFQLYYQIQIDNEHKPTGAEALIRWVHPTRGMVPPGQFIPVAEDSSLILKIGDWVLDTACRQLAAWCQNEKTRDLVLAINVSAQQFKQADFVEQVKIAIEKYNIEPSHLKLELTESIALDDIDFVIAKMLALKHIIGVELSLDDFGTGYSSLSYLKQLPLDQIKIDQSFVRDMTTDLSDAVMVKTIIDMAHNFDLNVIAEGVETHAQLDALKKMGCAAYQGYLFSKPVPLIDFESLLT